MGQATFQDIILGVRASEKDVLSEDFDVVLHNCAARVVDVLISLKLLPEAGTPALLELRYYVADQLLPLCDRIPLLSKRLESNEPLQTC
jgi:hypothetical protein